MGLSNAAVMRLNYPTHMMFKSCKLIPVMIGSMLILGKNKFSYILYELFVLFLSTGKRYTLYDVLACLCMTIGLIFFTLADSHVQPEFDLLGKNSVRYFIGFYDYFQVYGLYVVL